MHLLFLQKLLYQSVTLYVLVYYAGRKPVQTMSSYTELFSDTKLKTKQRNSSCPVGSPSIQLLKFVHFGLAISVFFIGSTAMHLVWYKLG